MSNVADEDSGPGVISLVIENEVSGKALAKEASKASRLLSRPDDDDDDDDNDDELFLDAVVVEDDLLVPLEVAVVALPDDDELPMMAPPAPPPTLPRAVVGTIDITSPGMRSSVVDILFVCLHTAKKNISSHHLFLIVNRCCGTMSHIHPPHLSKYG